MFGEIKENITKLILFFAGIGIITIILLIILIIKVSNLSATNTYNIEHVDTVVIQEPSEKVVNTDKSVK